MIVGLTGSIAAGKSAVSAMLEEMGAAVIDADLVARELQRAGQPAFLEIVEAFGREAVSDSGELDRKKLGEIVFSDPSKRAVLNAIVHPKVKAAFAARTAAALSANPEAVVVWDIPLLIEAGSISGVEKTIVVFAEESVQLRRLMARNGFSEEEAKKRIDSQMPQEEKKKYADFLIDNSGDLEALRSQAEAVWKALKQEKSRP